MFFVEIVTQILKEFFSILVTVFPYFILGITFSAILEVYTKPNFVYRYLNKGFLSVINASILGAILPGCACATMPMAEGLRRKGANVGTLSAFIMVSPLLSPQTVILTYALLGVKFTIARIVFSLSGAILLGIVFNYFQYLKIKGFVLPLASKIEYESCAEGKEEKNFLRSFFSIFKALGKYFFSGSIYCEPTYGACA